MKPASDGPSDEHVHKEFIARWWRALVLGSGTVDYGISGTNTVRST